MCCWGPGGSQSSLKQLGTTSGASPSSNCWSSEHHRPKFSNEPGGGEQYHLYQPSQGGKGWMEGI